MRPTGRLARNDSAHHTCRERVSHYQQFRQWIYGRLKIYGYVSDIIAPNGCLCDGVAEMPEYKRNRYRRDRKLKDTFMVCNRAQTGTAYDYMRRY